MVANISCLFVPTEKIDKMYGAIGNLAASLRAITADIPLDAIQKSCFSLNTIYTQFGSV